MSEHLGFIGVGRMGGPMAGRLIDAGHTLTVYDTSASATAALAARGARVAGSSREVADAVGRDRKPAHARYRSRSRAWREWRCGRQAGEDIHRSIDHRAARDRRGRGGAQGQGDRYRRLPGERGVGGARKGTLAVMAACERPLFERFEPILKVFGNVFYIGERPGMGQTMKLANNLLSATAMAISSEAIVMGVKAGLDPKIMIDVINSGSGRNTATQEKFPRAVLPRTFDYGFATGLMYKDVKLCLEEAEALNVPMWLGSAVRQLWQVAHAELGPASDFTQIVQCIEKWAGVEVKSDKV